MLPSDLLRLRGAIKNRLLTGPKRLEIEIITRCNLNCIFCWFHSPLVTQKIKNWHLETKVFKQIIDDAKDMNVNHVYITGRGEPCLHQNISEMLRYTTGKGFYVTLTTNLTTQSKKILSALSSVDMLEVTLCAASGKRYKELQCPKSKNLFNAVIKNIVIMGKISRLYKRPRIKINYILNKMNLEEAEDIVKMSQDIGVHEIRFSHLSCVPETRALLPDENSIHKACRKISCLSRGGRLIIDYTWQTLYNIKIPRCYMGWFTMLVGAFGKVKVGCFDSPLQPEGNIYKNSLKQIWLSRRSQNSRLRYKYNLEKFFPPLKHCPYAFQNKKIEDILQKIKNTPEGMSKLASRNLTTLHL